ncbi:MAG: 3-phosphoshikimate 1-carboxyvinyltransferase [Bacteroidetes bacterium]|nr:3-phosphoshikimate 1-carboxyvinyltransferase [Bacteroidota bacterium]
MIESFDKIKKIDGELTFPGDKSISHRALMISAMAEGGSVISNISNGEDVKSTRKCLSQLGTEILEVEGKVKVKGLGFKKFAAPTEELFAGNSGTTVRLLGGILAAQNFQSVITGDNSLSQRPMKRIIEPLTQMGGDISSNDFKLPLIIKPSIKFKPIIYKLPVASAQVKSAVLFAGLHCEDETKIIETIPSRNHTEKMLNLKTEDTEEGKIIYVSKTDYPKSSDFFVPSDISTAAYFIVLTLLAPNSSLLIKNISLNESRLGFINHLKKMGAKIDFENVNKDTIEPYGDLIVKSSSLKNVGISKEDIPNLIDEIPILSIAGLFAEGEFNLTNASELRHKESDRIKAVAYNLRRLKIDVDEKPDGFVFDDNLKVNTANFESFGDHRIAMSFAILSMLMKDGGSVEGFDCVKISNPNFVEQVKVIM